MKGSFDVNSIGKFVLFIIQGDNYFNSIMGPSISTKLERKLVVNSRRIYKMINTLILSS